MGLLKKKLFWGVTVGGILILAVVLYFRKKAPVSTAVDATKSLASTLDANLPAA